MSTAKAARRRLPLVLAIVAGAGALPAHAVEQEWRDYDRMVETNPRQVIASAQNAWREAAAKGDKAAELRAVFLLSKAAAISPDRDYHEVNERGDVLAAELGHMSALCWFTWVHAAGEESHDNFQKAGELLDQATALADRYDLETCRARVQMRRGYMAYRQGRSAEAMQWFTSAYQLSEAQGYGYNMAQALNHIGFHVYGTANSSPEDLRKAVGYLERSMTVIDPAVFRTRHLLQQMNLGTVYYRLHDLARARPLWERALALGLELQDPNLVTLTRVRLGLLAKDQGRYEEALRWFDQAWPLLPKQYDKRYVVSAVLARAEALDRLGRTKESLDALAQGQAMLAQMKNPTIEVQFYKGAAELHERQGNFKEAYRQMGALWEANGRLAELANAKLADELKVRFDVQLRDAENTRLRAERKQADADKLSLLLALALTLLLLGGIAFYLRQRAAAAKVQAQHHLALATAETLANRAKTTFLANMSHELRSPLNAVLGFTRLLIRRRDLATEARDELAIILKSGEQLYTLINQVLDLSKVEAGRASLQNRDFDLHEMADELSDMFGLAARDKGVHLRVECAGDTPRHVRADAVKLRQVLVNLLGNALKFTTHGSVSLRIGAIRPSPSSGMDTPRLSFAVVDTGAGISPGELKQLGHAFVQAQAGRQSQEGTGLGLAISRSFVELMGGSLRISSQLGRGTTVEFDIPAQSLDRGEAVPAAAPMRQVIGLAPEQVGFRILVVDDRAESRQLLSRLLGPLGFEVREAGDGAQAVEVAAEWQPQLIFMDMRMPVMDGREAARRIKASEKGSTTIIVALTASSLEDEHAEIMAAGCDAFLRKPFREEELFATLHRCLGVEFAYEDEAAPAAAMQETPDRHRLAALPAGLQAQLERALGRLDVNEVQAAIADIRRHDATLAAWLGQWAARFQYQRILSFLHDRGEADGEVDAMSVGAGKDKR